MERGCTKDRSQPKEKGVGDMDDRERDELLIRIDERLKTVHDHMETATSPEGFARCQVHTEQIKSLDGNMKWYKRGVFAVLITVLTKIGIDLF